MHSDTWSLLVRVWESGKGCSDICRDREGVTWVRLRVRDQACQREYLTSVSARSCAKVRLEQEILEICFPFQDGLSLSAWLRSERPSLGQRRDLCLALLAHCIEDKPAPGILTLAAQTENLRFSQTDAWLLYLPNWEMWQSFQTADAVRAVSVLCKHILMENVPALPARMLPLELQLICMRTERGDYETWETLQRDLSALPDRLLSLRENIQQLLHTLEQKTQRFRKPATYAVAAVLAGAAIFSLVFAFLSWRQRQRNLFPGITPIGEQQLIQESTEPSITHP